MTTLFKPLQKKVNGIIYTLIFSGILLLILGVLIVWVDFLARLVIGAFVLVIAYTFFYGAYKIISIKKDVKKIFKF